MESPGISRNTWLVRTAIVVGTVVIMLLGMELGFRLIGRPGWDRPVVAGWRCQAGNMSKNELGFRGQPFRYEPTNRVVVLLGDSHVESVANDFDHMPERLLERHLNRRDGRYRVFSLGSGGYGNDQQLLVLEEYFRKYRADLVVLWQTLHNDVWNNIFPTHWPKDGAIKPTFWLEGNELKGPNYRIDEVVMPAAKTKLGVLFNRVRHPQRGFDARWESKLPEAYRPLTDYEGPFSLEWDPSGPYAGLSPGLPYENLENEKSHYSVTLVPPSPRMEYGIALTRALLQRIRELCRKNNCEFVIFYTIDPESAKEIGANKVVVQKVGDRFYKSSRDQAEANRSRINEGFPTVRAVLTVEDWKVSPSDRHLNVAGNNQAMEILANAIGEMHPSW